jgi:N-acetylmuramoyl-L-alanine amidase
MTEQDLFALCLWREARGEGCTGMTAVAWVIWNRHKRWNIPVTRVIMGPNQFTSMSVDKNPPSPLPGDRQYFEAQDIVREIYAGTIDDPTNGACYYYNPSTADSPWFVRNVVDDTTRHPQSAKIGNHEFFL